MMAAGNRKRRQKPDVDRRRGQRAAKCPETGKLSWRTANAALAAAASLGSRAGQPVRTYLCGFCGRYHLTSQPRSS